VNRTGRRRLAALLVGSLTQLSVWLVVRPDRAGAQWTEGTALEVWLGAEALLAVAVGLLAPDRPAVVVTVVVGWLLQVLHFAVLGEHYDGTLWAVGMFIQGVFGAAAVGLAGAALPLVDRAGPETGPGLIGGRARSAAPGAPGAAAPG
jgi:hypothetical protein